MARAMDKLKVVVHAVVPPVVPWRLKMHRARAKVRLFMGIWRGKKPNRTDKGAIGANEVR